MSTFSRLTQVFRQSEHIPFDDNSKIVLISDCHRGIGDWGDDFRPNKNIYCSAIESYYKKGFTYIELGDGDELWENKSISDIIEIYPEVFKLLNRFYNEKRLYMLWGNHDIVKKGVGFYSNRKLRSPKKDIDQIPEPLFKGLRVHEGLILKHTQTGEEIFLVHGHQGDFINDTFWPLGRFLVRYIWKRLELLGFNDPTSAAKNYRRRKSTEGKIAHWASMMNQITIAGHTHRPAMPEPGGQKYFNDGCCVHSNSSISCIEIECGKISLVKWEVRSKNDGTMYIDSRTIAGPRELKEYFRRE